MNRLLLVLLCLLLWVHVQAQPVFRIDSLPATGVLLDKGWTFQAGDNPEWANPIFDDSGWASIDPTKDIFDLPQLDKNGRVGWFRLRLAIDSSVNQQLVMQIMQSGASELYLDGRLIHRFGVVGAVPATTEAFTPNNRPVSFPAEAGHEHLLSVRYALQPDIRYGKHFGTTNPGLTIRVLTTESSVHAYTNEIIKHKTGTFYAGAFGILAILFLTFYGFFPNRKESLYFFIYCLLMVATWYFFYLIKISVETRLIFQYNNLFLIAQVIAYSSMLNSIYIILNQKRGWLFSGLLLLGVIAILCGTYIYNWGWMIFGFGFTNLINVDITRVAIVAMRQQQKGAWILVAGGVIYLVCWAIFSLQFTGIINDWEYIDLFVVSILCIPVSFAIFFGYDSGITNRSLKQKLTEVQLLSDEKQHILATQNETLEKQVAERTAELAHKNRELEIEAALDKVRSRSLAMHKSDELQEVVVVVFEKLKELGLVFDGGAGIQLFTENSKDSILWVAAPGQITSPSRVNLPYGVNDFTNNPIILDVWQAKETGEAIYNKTYTREEKNRYFDYVFKHNDLTQVPQFVRDQIYQTPSYTQAFVAEKHSAVIANSWSGEVFPPDKFAVFKRIATVFEQAYIRFLDLQKAEAHAKQAKLDLLLIQTEKKRAEDALAELHITQAQLIQKEKLASLGELTAGIAHEIQNPLNFVNNFAQVSSELVDELKGELAKGDTAEAGLLADDLSQNLQKITHHGGRASAIVRGMLEHSRASSGQRQPTDLNALADEYLRLAYQGLRAKNNGFNCELVIDFAPDLGRVPVVQTDIGRVLLNLLNNAFYATQQRAKQETDSYQPTVRLQTERTLTGVCIRVSDNGIGIPEAIQAKIFQPFFTTKPTGEGTGLGLSLSYDIVTKGHGGMLEMESREDEGTEFVIILP